MSMGGPVVAALSLALALAACQGERPAGTTTASATDAPPTTAGDAPVPAEAVDYGAGMIESAWRCGEERVAARFDNRAGTATLTHSRGELVLPQAISASGARYADVNGNEFWSKGSEATLTLSGREPVECRQVTSP